MVKRGKVVSVCVCAGGGMGRGGELGIVLIHYTHAFINNASLRDTLHMTIRIWAYLCNYISLHTACSACLVLWV